MAITAGITTAMIAADQGFHQGRRQDKAQKQSLQRQDAAQQQAQAAAVSERRRAEMATAAANRKTPDIGELLAFEQSLPSGAAQTNLQSRKRGSLLGDS